MVTYSKLAAPLLLLLLVCAHLCQTRSAPVDDARAEHISRKLEQSGRFTKFGNGYLYQNDIRISAEQAINVLERQYGPASGKRWPNNIHYYIDDHPQMQGGYIQKAIKNVMDETCLSYIEEKENPGPKSTFPYFIFLNLANPTDPCSSYSGLNSKRGPQEIRVDKGCSVGTTVHELLHGLGMAHEMSRSDRNKYITVMWKNFNKDTKIDGKKDRTKQFGAPYDSYSIMQYGPRQGTQTGLFVYKPKNPLMQTVLGRGTLMSYYDGKIVNTAYKCIGAWQKKCPKTTCQNDGYVFKDCSCRCPEGTTGANCENKKMSYDDGILVKYFKDSGIVTSPGEIGNINKAEVHSKVIQAPDCKKVVLTFNSFTLEPRSSVEMCWDGYLNIITSGVVNDDGKFYCEEEIKPGTKFESTGSKMILHFQGDSSLPGYRADVTFEDIPDSCLLDNIKL